MTTAEVRHMPEQVGRDYPQRALCGVMIDGTGPQQPLCAACSATYIRQQADANPGNPFWQAKLEELEH